MLAAPSMKASHTRAGGPRTLVGGNDEPEHQQRRGNGGNADRCGEGLQQQHVGNIYLVRCSNGRKFSCLQEKPNATRCRQAQFVSGLPGG